jgi:hypothetical protein
MTPSTDTIAVGLSVQAPVAVLVVDANGYTPEPSTWVLVAAALFLVASARDRRRAAC